MAGTGEYTIADLAEVSPSPARPCTAPSSEPRPRTRRGNQSGPLLAGTLFSPVAVAATTTATGSPLGTYIR